MKGKKTKGVPESEIMKYKRSLKGLPKDEKITFIQQELNDRGISRMSPPGGFPKDHQEIVYSITDDELKELKKEIENNVEAYDSDTKRTELIPFMYDRDLNWYFNANNIPAQSSLVMPTYEYFTEGPGKQMFDPLDFFNLLGKQMEDLKRNLSKPFDILNNLKKIPLNERERHTLFGFILKWHGGYPVANNNEQYNTVLSLIQKDFLKFTEHTPEKEFCSSDVKNEKQFRELAAHLKAENKSMTVKAPNEKEIIAQHDIKESHYIRKVPFDFEDLPTYIVQRGIVWKFENEKFSKDDEYHEWLRGLTDFLNSIPSEYRLKALMKGIEYGKKIYKFHLDNECNNLNNCALNQSWQRRIALAEQLLEQVMPIEKTQTDSEVEPERKNKEFTTARQVLALHFIFEQLQVRSHEIDRTVKAKFVEFLTGKNYKNIYDALENPFISKDKKFRFEDLQFIRKYFEDIGLNEIVKAINNQLERPK
jgi:hypothetical protein